jgi:competence protein ComGC
MFYSPLRMSSLKAFTRVELCVVLASVSALALLALPSLANNKIRTERVSCWNNLRQIGRAFHAWAADHGNENPWIVDWSKGGLNGTPPAYVDIPGIGPYPQAARHTAWFQFLWAHRELGTPRILVCPSDVQRKTATTFSNYPAGGFLNAAYQNFALSYFVGLHATFDRPYEFLSGDRHLLKQSPSSSGCGFTTLAGISQIDPVDWYRAGWATNLLHGASGNILRSDGSVDELSQSGVRAGIQLFNTDNGYMHFLFP